MRSLKVWAVLLAGVMGVVSGMAQEVEASATAVFLVPTLIRLELDVDLIDFGVLTLADFERGYKDALGAQVVYVWSNQTWRLWVRADSEYWNIDVPVVGLTKPASDLNLRVGAVNKPVNVYIPDFTPLAITDILVAGGKQGGNYQLTMDFRLLLNWDTDIPGNYSLGFTYTLTAP